LNLLQFLLDAVLILLDSSSKVVLIGNSVTIVMFSLAQECKYIPQFVAR